VTTKAIVRDHDFLDGICRWCGGRSSENLAQLTCVPRLVEPPSRPTPTSIFADLTLIGDRMREIQADETAHTPSDTLDPEQEKVERP
jgi:hypothetical protein